MIVLFSYDGSDSADTALTRASGLLNRTDVEAVVLTIWEPLVVEALRAAKFGGIPAIPFETDSIDDQDEQLARRAAEHGTRLAEQLGLRARPLAVALPPAEQYDIAGAIIEAANTLDASVIVLGARGLTGIRAMLGSVSNHVAQHAHRPVLIIPPAATDTAAPAATPTSE
jgi:nucleotide-binding universal stress UspA family protein